jgi:hypothetical protein
MRFVTAEMPVQGPGTIDCGIWTSLMASLYVKTRIPDARGLASLDKEIIGVKVTASKNASAVGVLGRKHMIRMFKTVDFDKFHEVFYNLDMHFT